MPADEIDDFRSAAPLGDAILFVSGSRVALVVLDIAIAARVPLMRTANFHPRYNAPRSAMPPGMSLK